MSSILKALKKLEEESVARRSEPKDIARNILRERQRQPPIPWLPIIAGMAAVAAVAVLVTFALMGGFARPRDTSSKAAAETPASQPPTPRPYPSQDEPKPALTPAIASPAADAGETIPHAATKPTTAHPPRQATAVPQPQPSPQTTTPTAPSSRPVEESSRPPESPQPPTLRVTGIAWQKESASRFAVVNGQPVSEGATVSGARVETILPDRVVFAYGGQKVTAPLEK